MKRLAIAAGFLLCANIAQAQIPVDCKEAKNAAWIYQFRGEKRVEQYAQTARHVVVGCPITVRVEMWVDRTAAGAVIANDAFNANAYRIVPVGWYGTWVHYSHHWQIVAGITWIYNGLERRETQVVKQQETAESCIDGYWDGMQCIPYNTPIIFDVDRNGYHLTSAEDGVWFDLNADGTPEQVAWTHPDSDEAFLAMDRNGNGRIDDGSELFGDATPATRDPESGVWVNAANGFEALKFLENPDYGVSRADQILDANDAPFSQLLLWRDANHNGISEPDELTPAAAAGLESISADDVKTSGRRDRHGNLFRLRAVALFGGRSGYIYDVWLRSR
jgi:hypothetical protein